MKINIEGTLYIESDNYGFTVTRYGTRFDKAKGEEVETKDVLANFHTINGCADWIVNRLKVHESTATTLQELVNEVKYNHEWIKQQIGF